MLFRSYIVLLAIVLALLIPKAWDLRLLYLDADVRSKVEATLRQEAEKNGWVLSDLSIASLTSDTVRVCYREHRRGKDPISCFDAAL